MRIRLAQPGDLGAIADIYNHEVRTGTGTFDTEPVTLASRPAWLAGHDPGRHPVIVADAGAEQGADTRPDDAAALDPDDPGPILGWASLSSWSDRCAYARAAEVSVYVHHARRGRGVGRALLADLIARGRAAGLGVLLARICGASRASLALHAALGFQPIGTMRRVGEKFGRILDIELLDLQLDADVRAPDTGEAAP